ncbi:Metallo-dependent phosphatase-like protein [Dipodascopsis uninucleata]
MPTYEASYPPSVYRASRSRHPTRVFSNISGRKLLKFVTGLFTVLNLFRFLWIYTLLWGERWIFADYIKRCDWSKWENWPAGASPERVILVADPQLVDDNTYPGRNSLLLSLTEAYVDNYMHRAWYYLETELKSDATIFLGDLFDGGREWEHNQWLDEYRRFYRVFPSFQGKLTLHNVAGNHDIGLGDTIIKPALNRFQAYFGESSIRMTIGNHSFIILDTDSMMNQIDEEIYGPPRALFNSIAQEPPHTSLPRILLTHIPLFRPAETPCGPKREKGGSISISRGYQHQNVLYPDLSTEILDKIAPLAIFSGDDHDACKVEHRAGVFEYTVKSISIAMGVSYPAFEMISLWNPHGPASSIHSIRTYQTHLCVLHSQFDVFRSYARLFALTLVVVFYISYKGYQKKHKAFVGMFTGEKSKDFKSSRSYYEPIRSFITFTELVSESKWFLILFGRPGTMRWEFFSNIGRIAMIVLPYYMWLQRGFSIPQ